MKKITSQIKFIGGALSLIIITILLSILYMNEKSKSDSVVINISGRQRMISQKISKDVFYLLQKEDIDFNSLVESSLEFDNNLKDLIYGNAKKRIYAPPTKNIEEQLKKVKNIWLEFKKNVVNFQFSLYKSIEYKKFLFEKNEELLNFSDEIVKEIVRENVIRELVDISGRQRMLSQRMMYHLVLFLNTSEIKYYSSFFEDFKSYDETIKQLLKNKDLISKDNIKQKLTQNLEFWEIYSQKAKQLIELQDNTYKITNYINNHNLMLLETMDSAVSMYTNYSQEQRFLIQNIEYILGLIALVIMLYSWLLTKNIGKNFEDFLNQSKNLTTIIDDKKYNQIIKECDKKNELSEASSHLNNFVKKVDLMIVDAQKAIQSSNKISQEISNISLEIEKDLKNMQIDKNEKKDIENFIDHSEDIAIQSIEKLENSAKLLQKLHDYLYKVIEEKNSKN